MIQNNQIDHWHEIKNEIKKVWGDLSPEELDQTNYDIHAIKKLIHEKYDQEKNEVLEKLLFIFKKFGPTAEQIKKSI
jgi:hypothetical protein